MDFPALGPSPASQRNSTVKHHRSTQGMGMHICSVEHLCDLPPKRHLLHTLPATITLPAQRDAPKHLSGPVHAPAVSISSPPSSGKIFLQSARIRLRFTRQPSLPRQRAKHSKPQKRQNTRSEFTWRKHFLFFFFLCPKQAFFCSFLCFSTHTPSRKLNAMQMKRVQLESPPGQQRCRSLMSTSKEVPVGKKENKKQKNCRKNTHSRTST